ncbi:MAG: iron transporter [Sphingobium sp.]
MTAIAGGYAAAAGVAAFFARTLPVSRAEATGWAMILSFLLYACLMLWSFHEARLSRVVATIWGIAVLSAGVVWMLGPRA